MSISREQVIDMTVKVAKQYVEGMLEGCGVKNVKVTVSVEEEKSEAVESGRFRSSKIEMVANVYRKSLNYKTRHGKREITEDTHQEFVDSVGMSATEFMMDLNRVIAIAHAELNDFVAFEREQIAQGFSKPACERSRKVPPGSIVVEDDE